MDERSGAPGAAGGAASDAVVIELSEGAGAVGAALTRWENDVEEASAAMTTELVETRIVMIMMDGVVLNDVTRKRCIGVDSARLSKSRVKR
jgi:hypothetical protein